MFSRSGRALALALGFVCLPSWAQVTVPDEYAKTIAHHSDIGTLTDDFAGDSIDLSTGRLEIVQTDVDLPGSNALLVRVERRFEVADANSGGHFGMSSLNIPSVHGTFSSPANLPFGWMTDAGTSERCSEFSAPPVLNNVQGGTWFPDEYWHGTFFHLPGSGDQELLQIVNAGHQPSDGHAYHALTKIGSMARCVALDPNSVQGAQGEGFEVVTRDGTIYTLNHMVMRYRSALSRPWPAGLPSVAPTYNLQRSEYFLYPTKVTDRFGNTVTYVWNANEPWQLQRIVASDGRQIDFTYVADGTNRVASVTAGSRTWLYAYGPGGGFGDVADTLTLPDGTVWTYRLRNLHYMATSANAVNCSSIDGQLQRTGYDDGTASGAPYTGSIAGPSGATVTFSVARVVLGRSHVGYNCLAMNGNPAEGYASDPYLFVSAAVVGKTMTGPGLPASGLHWHYAYGPSNNCWDGTYSQGIACTANSPTTRSTIVTDPQGGQTRYTFGNRVNVDEGLLYRTERGWNGSSALETTEIVYADPEAAPYNSYNGWSPRGNGDFAMTSMQRPQRKVMTTRQGRTFTWEVATGCGGAAYCFDSFARPTRVIRSSTP